MSGEEHAAFMAGGLCLHLQPIFLGSRRCVAAHDSDAVWVNVGLAAMAVDLAVLSWFDNRIQLAQPIESLSEQAISWTLHNEREAGMITPS